MPDQKITLAVSSYNQLEYLRDAMQSALEQTRPFHQVVVVDDGSDDGSVDYLCDLANHHAELDVIAFAENRGRSASRNAGIEAATGDYLAFLDGDDFLSPDAHEEMQALITDDAPEAAVYGNVFFDDATGKRYYATGRNAFYSEDGLTLDNPDTEEARALLLRTFPSHWTKLYRMDFLHRFGTSFKGEVQEDMQLHFWSLLAANHIRCTPRVLVSYRVHEGSVLNTTSDIHFGIFDAYERVERTIAKANCTSPVLQQMCRRHRFTLLSFAILRTERIPPARRPEYARRILAIRDLTEFELNVVEKANLAEIRVVADTASSLKASVAGA